MENNQKKKKAASLAEMIKAVRFDYVDKGINEYNFPNDGRRGKVELIDFGEDGTVMKSTEIEAEMAKRFFRPATLRETLEWAKENWNGQDNVVAFGSGYLDNCPDDGGEWLYLVPYLSRNKYYKGGKNRQLYGLRIDFGWNFNCHFAVVRRKNS